MALQPVIPVLSLNTDQLTKMDDQLAYLLRHAFYNPGWTSSQIESSLVSMRRLLAQYENDRNEFVNALKQKLESAVKRLYATFSVNVDSYTISPTRYGVTIAILDNKGRPIVSSDVIRVENNEIILKFDRD